MRYPLIVVIAALTYAHAAHAQSNVNFDEGERHHFSLVFGGAYVDDADETAFTLGGDYEYRLNPLIGVGAVAERAFGAIDSTTLLAVADIHLWRGLAMQLGPGVEFVEREQFAVGRIGALYEFEVSAASANNAFTISPQLHYDVSSKEDAIVFVMAIGKAF